MAPLGKLPRILFLAPHSVPSCLAWAGDWWFSPVATISGSDTLIEPHYFQVCGTLQGHCAGGSCVFNYCRTMKECNASSSSVIFQPLPGWPKTKPIGLSPGSCYGMQSRRPENLTMDLPCVPGLEETDRQEGLELVDPHCKFRQPNPFIS